jgi:amino acid permease
MRNNTNRSNRYPATSLFIALGRLGIVLLVGLSYPLQLLPCRACVDSLTSSLDKPHTRSGLDGNDDGHASENEDEEDPLMPKDIDDQHDSGTSEEMSITKFLIITASILISGFLIALAVDELEVGEYRSLLIMCLA